jgi:hypothetical protein
MQIIKHPTKRRTHPAISKLTATQLSSNLGMIGSKGDLKQGILGALTAGFNAKVLHQ